VDAGVVDAGVALGVELGVASVLAGVAGLESVLVASDLLLA
jgi:hypothetical protein